MQSNSLPTREYYKEALIRKRHVLPHDLSKREIREELEAYLYQLINHDQVALIKEATTTTQHLEWQKLKLSKEMEAELDRAYQKNILHTLQNL